MSGEISVEAIATKILFIRDKRVLLDKDLARLYGVPTKVFNQSVKRNIKRFPSDFMFRLKWHEVQSLRSQFVTLKEGKIVNSKRGKHVKYLPHVFTEQGVAMLSSVLNSERAIRVNIQIMRAFVKLREFILTHKGLADKIEELEKKFAQHDIDIKDIFEAIRQMMRIPREDRRINGFAAK